MDKGYFQQCSRKEEICGKSEGLHSTPNSIIFTDMLSLNILFQAVLKID